MITLFLLLRYLADLMLASAILVMVAIMLLPAPRISPKKASASWAYFVRG